MSIPDTRWHHTNHHLVANHHRVMAKPLQKKQENIRMRKHQNNHYHCRISLGNQSPSFFMFKMLFFNFSSGEQAKRAQQEKVEAQAAQQAAMQAIESESKQVHTSEPSAMSQINFAAYGRRAVSFLARNFYNLKYVALVLAFCINFMLLFYKVIFYIFIMEIQFIV